MVPPERVGVQTLQGRQVVEFLAGQPVDGTRRRPRCRSVDDHHTLRAAHLEGDVHTGGATVDQPGAVGHATLPQVADQHGTHTVVTAEQVAAADDQDRVPRRLDIDLRGAGIETAWVVCGVG